MAWSQIWVWSSTGRRGNTVKIDIVMRIGEDEGIYFEKWQRREGSNDAILWMICACDRACNISLFYGTAGHLAY